MLVFDNEDLRTKFALSSKKLIAINSISYQIFCMHVSKYQNPYINSRQLLNGGFKLVFNIFLSQQAHASSSFPKTFFPGMLSA